MRRYLIRNTTRTLCFNDIRSKMPNIGQKTDTQAQTEIKKEKEISELNEDLNRLGNDFRVDVNQQEESHEAKEEIEHEHLVDKLKSNK